MCGIGAFQIVQQEIDAHHLAQILLRNLTVRGRDASGVAWHSDTERQTYIQKQNIDGYKLAKAIDTEIGSTCIVHTRYATKGVATKNANNHPIDVQGMIGVHNGHISNDDELFKVVDGYTRRGEVDSEAAFATLMHGPKALGLYGRLQSIRGGAALIWLNSRGPRKLLHAARLTASPLVFGHTEKGSVILASTKQILLQSAREVGVEFEFVYELAEGEYMRWEKGVLIQSVHIPMPKLFTPKPARYITPYQHWADADLEPYNFRSDYRNERMF